MSEQQILEEKVLDWCIAKKASKVYDRTFGIPLIKSVMEMYADFDKVFLPSEIRGALSTLEKAGLVSERHGDLLIS